jgi:hypothetical protein
MIVAQYFYRRPGSLTPHSLCRRFIWYIADSLRSTYAPPIVTVQAPAPPSTPTHNPCNHTATFKLSHENFLEMNDTPTCHHKDKKAHTKTGTDDDADDTSLSNPNSANWRAYGIPSHHDYHAGHPFSEDSVD